MKSLSSTDQIILDSDKNHVLRNNCRIWCKSNLWLFSCVLQTQLTPLFFFNRRSRGEVREGARKKSLLSSLNLSQESWEFNCVPEHWETDNLCCNTRGQVSQRKPHDHTFAKLWAQELIGLLHFC